MTTTHYTSLELSKWLAENGCKLHASNFWMNYSPMKDDQSWEIMNEYDDEMQICGADNRIPAFDLIWDICVKYPEEFFPKEYIKTDDGALTIDYVKHGRSILLFLQHGRAGQAEDYIKEHCVFNPANQKSS